MNGFEVMSKFHFDCECGPVGPARSNPSWHLTGTPRYFRSIIFFLHEFPFRSGVAGRVPVAELESLGRLTRLH